MPKRPELDPKEQAGLFKKTGEEPPNQPEPEKPDDPIKPRGIGLRASEWQRLAVIGRGLGKKPHALAAWAIRDFMRRYEAGEIRTETKKTLPGL
jgi:hypothetical protein